MISLKVHMSCLKAWNCKKIINMKKYFYSNGHIKEGPVSLEELKLNDIKPNTLIWYEGLEDWKEAESVEELREIFELSPPPIYMEKDKLNTTIEITKIDDINERNTLSSTSGLRAASEGWILAGFIFLLLGGYLGIIIGCNYAFGNYKKETKSLGWVMIILGIFSAIVWRSV